MLEVWRIVIGFRKPKHKGISMKPAQVRIGQVWDYKGTEIYLGEYLIRDTTSVPLEFSIVEVKDRFAPIAICYDSKEILLSKDWDMIGLLDMSKGNLPKKDPYIVFGSTYEMHGVREIGRAHV